jgi:hypothetical protein
VIIFTEYFGLLAASEEVNAFTHAENWTIVIQPLKSVKILADQKAGPPSSEGDELRVIFK